MADRNCVRCGTSIPADRIASARYCTHRCQKAGERERARARGYQIPRVETPCSNCGIEFMAERVAPSHHGQRRYCSPSCQAEAKAWRYRKVFSVPVPWADCQDCGARYVARGTALRCRECRAASRRRWISGQCLECGGWFIGRWHPEWPCRYCSDRCIKKAARTRRRAAERAGFVEVVHRQKVYERDQWTCRICNEPVVRDALVPFPLAPTIDHIVPYALGGDHCYANVQCAHFICNSRKTDRVEGQIRLAA